MTQQIINIGAAPNDNTGDPLRTAFDKANDNFSEIYPLLTFQQAGAGAVIRSSQDKMREIVSAKDYGAVGDGATNDRAAFIAADALGAFALPPGLYSIASSLTIANRVTFAPGARIVIPTGVTVTFNGGITAEAAQIFNLTGSGTVAGLGEAHAQWFCGDISWLAGGTPSATPCGPLMIKAFAAVGAGIVHDGPWLRLHDGTAYIDMAQASYDGGRATFLWNGTTRKGIKAASGWGGFARDFNIAPLNLGFAAVDGEALSIGRSDLSVSGFRIDEPFVGLGVLSTAVGVTIRDFRIYNAVLCGYSNSTSDVYVSDFIIQALDELVVLTGITGAFNIGDTLNIAGVTDCKLNNKHGADRMRIFSVSRIPVAGDAVTSSSGGTATVGAVTVGHQLGGIRWSGRSEAVGISAGDVLGGLYSFTSAGSGVIGPGNTPAYNRIHDDVYFDTSWSGAQLDGDYGSRFDCWFSNPRLRNSVGVTLLRVGGNTKFNAHIVASRGYGMLIDATCDRVDISGTKFDGNCITYDADAAMAELRLLGAPMRITANNISGGHTPNISGSTPPRFITVDAAGSDYIKFVNVSCPVTAGMITWGSTGTHNRRVACDSIADL